MSAMTSSTPSAAAIPSDVDECERLLRGIVLPPRTQSMVDDPEPAAFSPSIRVGSGKHALAVELVGLLCLADHVLNLRSGCLDLLIVVALRLFAGFFDDGL